MKKQKQKQKKNNNQKQKTKNATAWTFQASNKRNLTRENFEIAEKRKP